MPGPWSPSDTLVGPVVNQLISDIHSQIPSIVEVYFTIPDSQPLDNSVILPMIKAKVIDDTNGKMKVKLMFALRHVFRRTKLSDDIARAYTYVQPWLYLLSAWLNQGLGGLSIDIDIDDLVVTRVTQSGQVMVAIAINFAVLTEFNIVLT